MQAEMLTRRKGKGKEVRRAGEEKGVRRVAMWLLYMSLPMDECPVVQCGTKKSGCPCVAHGQGEERCR